MVHMKRKRMFSQKKKKLSNFFSPMFSYNQTKPDIFKPIHSVRTS